jgi:O-glycosyl hydrolase
MLVLLLSVGLAVNAQTKINLSGTVKNKAGSPINKAIVTLAKQTLKDTTGTDGKFELKDGVSVLPILVPHEQNIILNGNTLEFSLVNPAPVKVEIFDINGNLLHKEMQNGQKGFYRLDIAAATNVLLIHASIGSQVMTFRYLPLGNGKYMVSSKNTTLSGSKLTKVAATINDTLKVSATNYISQAITLSKYDTTINITLDTVPSNNGVTVNLDQTKQTMVGFGINACLMSGSIFNIDECFGTTGKDALGMSVLRIGMDVGGDHRSVPSGWEKARTQYNAKIIGSCWSAPKEWKTNNNENDGGHLKKEYYTQWAERIATYAKKYNLYAMGISNEADFSSACAGTPPCTDHYASMTYTGKEMVDFVKEARKAFTKISPDTKMMAPEASLWIHVWSNISPTEKANGGYNSSDPHGCGCFSNDITEEAAAKCAATCQSGGGYDYGHWLAKDTVAWNALDILGVHEYESQKAYVWPADVTGGKRTKDIFQTEMSGVMYWPEQGPSVTIENGVAVARWIQSALMVGEASAWCWWWYGAPYYTSDDNEGLALIKGNSQKAKRYYTYGNFSKYIRPGQKIVNVTGTDKLPAKVLLTASKDDAGKVVIVAVNETTSEQTVPITISGGTAPASFTPIVTDKDNNWKEGTAVSVSGGVLTATLAKMSVTTFVSK